jgi:hypothetical protein
MWTFIAGFAAGSLLNVEPTQVRRAAVSLIVNTALGAAGARRWVQRTAVQVVETVEDIVAEAKEHD